MSDRSYSSDIDTRDQAETVRQRYAGLQQVFTPGLSVAQVVERLRRFAYVEQRFMRLLASRIVTLPQRPIKVLLGRLQYEDARHADLLRQRLLELRTNKNKLEQVPDPALELLFDEAEHLPAGYPFLMVVTQLLKPALCAAYQSYLATTNDLADYPSVRMLRQHVTDEQEHLQLLVMALQDISPSEQERQQAEKWQQLLTLFLAAAGGIDGTVPRSATQTRNSSRTAYHIPHILVRDDGIPRVWDYVAPPLQEAQPRLSYIIGLRLSEINVAEGLALVLCETPNMPWSFYFDISRHCWDETRHSLFGEVGAEATYGDHAAVPMRDYEGVFVMEASLLEQYAVLGLEVEGKNMKYPPGKRQEWEFARDIAQHPLMTTFQDFDWADEVLHVNIARRQLDDWFEGGLKAIGPLAASGKEHRTRVKQRNAPSVINVPSE